MKLKKLLSVLLAAVFILSAFSAINAYASDKTDMLTSSYVEEPEEKVTVFDVIFSYVGGFFFEIILLFSYGFIFIISLIAMPFQSLFM